MPETIIIGCRLPNGITLSHPKNPKQIVTLNGLNKSLIIGANHVTTEVDSAFWTAWKAANKEFTPYATNNIFEATSVKNAADTAKELTKEKTGFEPMTHDDMEHFGVKPYKAE